MTTAVSLLLVAVWVTSTDSVISRYYGGIGRLLGWI